MLRLKMMLFRYVLTVLIALVNVAHYVMTMILMLVDVLQWPLRKKCVMSFVRLLLLLFICVGLSTSSFFDCIVCFCMSCSLFTAFVANKLHHIYVIRLQHIDDDAKNAIAA